MILELNVHSLHANTERKKRFVFAFAPFSSERTDRLVMQVSLAQRQLYLSVRGNAFLVHEQSWIPLTSVVN